MVLYVSYIWSTEGKQKENKKGEVENGNSGRTKVEKRSAGGADTDYIRRVLTL